MSLKLSICIPTYNRAGFLAQTLENVIAQATSEVEIVVSDNASSDNTEEVVRSFQLRFPRLTYFRQSENRGFDRNCLNAVTRGQGEYCWLFGDDDLMMDGAIPLLITKYLSIPPNSSAALPEFIQLSVEAWDFTMTKPLGRSAGELGVCEDVYTSDVLTYFADFFRESYLSGFVVRHASWVTVDAEKYVGTGLSYQAAVYEYLQIDSPVVFVASPLLKYRSGNPSWSDILLDFMIRDVRYVLDTLPTRYDPVKAAALRGFEERLPVTLMLLARLRADGHYDLARYRKYMCDYFATRPIHRTCAFLLAVTPPGFLKGLQTLHKKRI